MSIATPRLTWRDLEQFPVDNKRREIVGGVLYVAAAPLRTHQEVSIAFFLLLVAAVRVPGWGRVYYAPVAVRLSDEDLVQPDVVVLRRERLDIYRGNTVHGPPDLVVEVLSPSNRDYDEVDKFRLYEASGIPEYWLADPAYEEVRGFALVDGRYVPIAPDADGMVRSTVVPGLVVDPAALFADLEVEA